MRLRRSSSRMRGSGRHLKSLRQPRLRRPTSSRPRARATCPAPQPDGSRPCMCAFRPCSRPCALCVRPSQNSMRCSTMSKRRASMPCPLARIRTSQNGAVTSAYSAASVRRGFLVYPLGGWNLRCDRMRCNALPYALSRTRSRRQASSLRRIARPTGRSLRWCASTPWSSDSTPCCARSISCSLLWKNSMVHSLMSRKSASIGSRRCKDDLSRVRYKNSGGGTGVEVSGMSPCWREHLKKFVGRRSRSELNYDTAPGHAIGRQRRPSRARSWSASFGLATSLIERKPIRSGTTPCIQERLDHSPTGLDPIRPLEQDRVPDHAIIDQRLVASARCGVKIILVFKCHADARNRDHRTRHLGAKLQTDALVGLNADDQEILRQPVHRRVAKHRERSLLELDRHFSSLRFERLSSAEIERNTRPTPIVDHELECDVGFGCAVWDHIGRSPIILDFVVPHPRRHILRAH